MGGVGASQISPKETLFPLTRTHNKPRLEEKKKKRAWRRQRQLWRKEAERGDEDERRRKRRGGTGERTMKVLTDG